MPYEILVSDNFEAPPPAWSPQRAVDTPAEALAFAQRCVDIDLRDAWRPGMSAAELYDQYRYFGEAVLIVAIGAPKVHFDGWRYARSRCELICALEKARNGA